MQTCELGQRGGRGAKQGWNRKAMPRKAARPCEENSINLASLSDRLRPVINRLARHLRREAVDAGISSLDVLLLGIIKVRPGIGVSELAAIEDTTRPTMSAHVKRLRGIGWVTTDNSMGTDLRRSHLMLTDAGREAQALVRKRSNDWLAKQIAVLPQDQVQALHTAIPALEGLLNNRTK